MRSKKKLKLKRIWCFVLGIICCLAFQQITKLISNSWDEYYRVCDEAYGYTTDYYTCRQYHIHNGK